MVIQEVTAKIEYEFKDENEAFIYYQTLLPEFKKGFPGIMKSSIDLIGNKIIIEIHSLSVSRLRAILNSINRWLISMSEVIKYTEVEKIGSTNTS